ncbi:hypothetical protein glysoja_001168 [Glycine soja]|nr:hypothetical protein JHK86_051031 [Glycine max]KHN40670.1 hypothetical protein glysoja_001168 [Glycine soja]
MLTSRNSKESILQVNTPPHQLIGKEERHGERDKSFSVILSLNTNTSLAIVWKAFSGYMSFMESPAQKRKCKEDVFYEVKKTVGMSCISEVIRSDPMPVQVVWPGVQLPFVGGDTFGTCNDDVVETADDDDYVVDITAA